MGEGARSTERLHGLAYPRRDVDVLDGCHSESMLSLGTVGQD